MGYAALFDNSKSPLVYLQPASVSNLYLVSPRDLKKFLYSCSVVCARSNVSIACAWQEIEWRTAIVGMSRGQVQEPPQRSFLDTAP